MASPPDSRSGKTPAEAAQEMLKALWHRNLPVFHERLNQLDRAAAAARRGSLLLGEREDAANTAHKLSGSLGMFGYPHGSELARQLELLLESPGTPDPVQLVALTAELRDVLGLQRAG